MFRENSQRVFNEIDPESRTTFQIEETILLYQAHFMPK